MITKLGRCQLNQTESKFVNDTLLGILEDTEVIVTVSNRYTGASHRLPRIAHMIFSWISEWQDSYDIYKPNKSLKIKEFDMARNLFRKAWPNAYFDLLD